MGARLTHFTMQFFMHPVAQWSNPEVILHLHICKHCQVSVFLCQTCEKASRTQWIKFGKQFLSLNALQDAVLLRFC